MLRPSPCLSFFPFSFSPPLLASSHILCTIPEFSTVIERYTDRRDDEGRLPKIHTLDFSFPIRWAAVLRHLEIKGTVIRIKNTAAAVALGCSALSVVSEYILWFVCASPVCSIGDSVTRVFVSSCAFQPSQKVFVNWPVWHRTVVHHKEWV